MTDEVGTTPHGQRLSVGPVGSTDTRPIDVATRPRISAEGTAAPLVPEQPPVDALNGRYILELKLGQGNMGQVWKARDLLAANMLDQHPYVAIKLLKSGVNRTAKDAMALHQESKNTSELAHPNIATVRLFEHDLRTDQYFMVMELLEGTPLDRKIREVKDQGLPAQEARPLILGLAEGLAYAHKKGVVHSDVKPSNVFITQDGTAKLLDFGIAQMFRPAMPDPQPWVDDSAFTGYTGYTAAYASPEAMQTRKAHPSDDVYSLGLVAYELLTGRHPFDGKSGKEAVLAKLRPAPVSKVKRREWEVLKKALALSRTDRYPDAAAFRRALQPGPGIPKVFAAITAVALIAAGIFAFRSWVENRPIRPFSDLPVDTQRQIQEALDSGNESLRYVETSGDVRVSEDAAQHFADAYAQHPRNPEAVEGLEKSADLAIAWFRKQPDRTTAAKELRKFQAMSDYYRNYAPLQNAIDDLDGY